MFEIKCSINIEQDLFSNYHKKLKDTKEKLIKIGINDPNSQNFSEFLKTIGSKSFQDKFEFQRYDSPLPTKKNISPFIKSNEKNSNTNKNKNKNHEEIIDSGAPVMKQDIIEVQQKNQQNKIFRKSIENQAIFKESKFKENNDENLNNYESNRDRDNFNDDEGKLFKKINLFYFYFFIN